MQHSNSFETHAWAQTHFANVKLCNKRRTQRLISIAQRLAENKGQSLARLFDGWYDVKATYTLLSQKVMTPNVIQSSHRQHTYQSILEWEGDILAIEDASEFEWNNKNPIEGLGPIGSGREGDQGFILHSTLAVGVEEGSFKILGLPFQQYYVRPPKREIRVKRSFSSDPIETDLWTQIIKKKALPPLNKVVRVCDRATDIYEGMTQTEQYGCKFVIRLKHDRKDLEQDMSVKELIKNLPLMGKTEIELRGREGKNARTISLDVNWKRVQLRAPARPGISMGKLPPLEVNVVHVWGIDPETNKLIEWFLYTNIEVNNLKDALKIIRYYAARWIIEDYHKALKSGLKAERLQLEKAHALFAAIAIMSVVALRLIDLREAMRTKMDAPAKESGLEDIELKVLSTYLKRELKTVRCVGLAIGRLGGHQNRKADGMPGIMTLWLGMSRLLQLVEAVKLASELYFEKFG